MADQFKETAEDLNTRPDVQDNLSGVERWAVAMGGLAHAIADVLRYEGETLHKAVAQGAQNASETFAAALRSNEKGTKTDGE